MAYTEITTLWSGFPGGPGYSRIRFAGNSDGSGATAMADRVQTFFTAVAQFVPSVVRLQVQSPAELFDATGLLTASVDFSPPPEIAGQAPGPFASSTGAVVGWVTSTVTNGRRVRGRTFLVPLGGSAFDTDGTLSGGTVNTLRSAANALVAGTPNLIVGSRQDPGVTGQQADVQSARVPDLAAVLRSRRD